MSLLNDALRKKDSEAKTKETGFINQQKSVPRKVNGGKILRTWGLPLLLVSLVIGVWYLWGSISAQVESVVAVSSISEDIKTTESDSAQKTNPDDKGGVAPESGMLKPKRDITPLEEPVEIATIKKNEPAPKSGPDRVSPAPAPTVKKKPRRVQKQSPQQASKSTPKSVATHQETRFFKKALRYHQQGKFNQAIRMYREVLTVAPDHRDALFNLAAAYIQLAAYSEALPLLNKLRNYDRENPDVLVNLAIAEIGLGESAEAIRLLDLAAKQVKEPNFAIYFHRAAALSRLGRLQEALSSYKLAKGLNAKHPPLNFNIAVLCDKLQQYNEAVYYYRAFIQHSDNLSQFEEQKIELRIRALRAYLAGNRS